MESEEVKNLEYLNNFLGYGCSDTAKIFYFGIEEHGRKEEDKGVDFYYNEFIDQRNKNQSEILGYTTISGTNDTEGKQSILSYRILNDILKLSDFKFKDENDYLSSNVARIYEFSSNLYPIACAKDKSNNDKDSEKSWPYINKKITGYEDKDKYREDCWDEKSKDIGIVSRETVLKNFLTKIKERMQNEDIFIFSMMGNPHYETIKSLIECVFEIDFCDKNGKDKVLLKDMFYINKDYMRGKIWSTYHPSPRSGKFRNEHIDCIIDNLKIIFNKCT